MLRGVIFDFDGVIANSEPLHLRGFQDVLGDLGLELGEADYYARYLGYDDAGVYSALAADRGLAWTPAQIAGLVEKKATRLEELEREHSVLFPGAAATIRRLAARGPLAIASGALRAEILRILTREGLDSCFRLVVAAEDAASSKPSPAPYLKALEGLSGGSGGAAGYVAIEDSHWGLESARAAGLKTVAVTNTYPAEQLDADLTVANLDDLDWLKLENLVNNV